MRKNIVYPRLAPLLIPLAASLVLGSCVAPVYSGGGRHTIGTGGYGVYASLPRNYNGSAYYYNGRYYSGGTYQTGRYHHNGRAYGDRYAYNGNYFYGGVHQQHAANASHQVRNERGDRRHASEQGR